MFLLLKLSSLKRKTVSVYCEQKLFFLLFAHFFCCVLMLDGKSTKRFTL